MRTAALVFILLFGLTELASAHAIRALSRPDLLAKLQAWESDVREWKPTPEYRLEKDLELEWICRLKSAALLKYRETDASFIGLIEDINEVEKAPENASTATLGAFLDALLKSIREDREPTESLFEFIREATERGSIQSPPEMEAFSRSRDYRSQGLSAQAEPLELDDAGESLAAGELEKPLRPELTPEPAVLDAAEGDLRSGTDDVIERDESALHLPGDAVQLDPILREDGAAEPVDRAVREL